MPALPPGLHGHRTLSSTALSNTHIGLNCEGSMMPRSCKLVLKRRRASDYGSLPPTASRSLHVAYAFLLGFSHVYRMSGGERSGHFIKNVNHYKYIYINCVVQRSKSYAVPVSYVRTQPRQSRVCLLVSAGVSDSNPHPHPWLVAFKSASRHRSAQLG